MTNYEIRWQNQKMWKNGEWSTYHYDSWQEAITDAWEMRYDPNYVTIEVYEIHIITFKDDNNENNRH